MDRRNFIKNTALCSSLLCLDCKMAIAGNEVFQDKSHELPKRAKLEACTLCQLSCPECWRTTTPNYVPLGYLKFEDFKKFVDKNPFIEQIELSNYGELFLNPDLKKIINYAYEKNVLLSANTGVNLNLLSDEIAELMVKTKFKELTLSIDGATQEVYSIYRRGGNLNNVIENIKKIQYYQKKYNTKYPEMTYKFIVFGHNEHEIPKAKELAKELGLPIKFAINVSGWYSPIKNKEWVEKETGLKVTALSSIPEEYDNSYLDILYKEYLETGCWWFFCNAIFNEPSVFYDGTFVGCCMCHYWDAPKLNVFDIGLKNALESKEVRKIIDVFGMKTDAKGTICQNCSVYRYLKSNNCKITRDDRKNYLKNKMKEQKNG